MKYNLASNESLEINGIDRGSAIRKSIIDWRGNGWYRSDVMCGGDNQDNASHKLSLKANSSDVYSKVEIEAIKNSALYMLATEDGCTVKLNSSYTYYGDAIVQYSTDYINWNNLSDTEVSIPNGSKLYLRGKQHTRNKSASSSFSAFFITTGRIEMYGDLAYLVNYESLKEPLGKNALNSYFMSTTITKAPFITSSYYESSALYALFKDCANLTEALKFINPIVAIGNSVFSSLFENCTNLTKTYPIYVEYADDFSILYKGCISLVNVAPIYINKAINVRDLFNGCTSLEQCEIYVTNYCAVDMRNEYQNMGNFDNVPSTCKVYILTDVISNKYAAYYGGLFADANVQIVKTPTGRFNYGWICANYTNHNIIFSSTTIYWVLKQSAGSNAVSFRTDISYINTPLQLYQYLKGLLGDYIGLYNETNNTYIIGQVLGDSSSFYIEFEYDSKLYRVHFVYDSVANTMAITTKYLTLTTISV